jgi:hypothetical protein
VAALIAKRGKVPCGTPNFQCPFWTNHLTLRNQILCVWLISMAFSEPENARQQVSSRLGLNCKK